MPDFNLHNKRILIVKPSSLGDIVHTVPVVHAIKRVYPTAHVGWIIQRGFAGLIEGDPSVDEPIPINIPSTSEPGSKLSAYWAAAYGTFSTCLRLRQQFRNNPYDFVLDLHASFRGALLGKMNPNGIRIGLADAKELNTYFQNVLVHPKPDKPHAVDKNLLFCEIFKIEPEPEDFRLRAGPEAHERVESFLKDCGIEDRSRLVYANPATRWETKHWHPHRWAELTDLLINELRADVIFGGGAGDLDYINSILEKVSTKPVIAAGRLNLQEAIALLEKSSLYVGVDSGPMHMAAFTGVRVCALFGPTDPAKVGPYGTGHVVIRNDKLSCLVCRKRRCETRECLYGITAETVFERIRAMMNW
jgi:heptosyltransferase I